ncbi:hypothetical protein [Evansella halocellulosilytica]|uniref:hypothetical protein n=1 Tax=Evansella halocellulosilytica TaxID=2011013 RepID=UPI000BB81930|nr:hypothetical protein [Evansella halocellulosilytica]
MPGMPQDVAYCPVDGSSFKMILEEEEAALAPAVTRRRLRASSSARLIEEANASKQLVENSGESCSLLLRLLVADCVLLPLPD